MVMLRGVARAADAPTSVKKGTIPRIWAFARPYRGWLLAFLLLTVVSATVGVLTPVLAGRVVNAIVAGGNVSAAAGTVHRAGGRDRGTRGAGGRRRARVAVVLLAHRRGSDRRPAPRRVRARAADAGGVLHAHPHGSAGEQAQQRRDRRAVGDHVDAGRRAEQRDPARARPRRDDLAGLAGHAARAPAAAGLRAPGPPDGPHHRGPAPGVGRPQRRHEHADDRAVLRARRHAREALRPARRGGAGVRGAGRAGARHRGAHGDGLARLRHGAVAGLRARPGARLRPRRLPRRHRRDRAGHGRHPRAAADQALHADDGPGERARRRDDRARVVRARLRGARPEADDHRAARRAGAAGRAGGRAAARRPVRLPERRPGLARLPRGRRRARHPRRRRGAARRGPGGRRRPAGGARRLVRGREVDAGLAGAAALRRGLGRGGALGCRRARPDLRRRARGRRGRDAGRAPVPRHDPGQPELRRPGRHRRRDRRRAAAGAAG